MRRSDIALIGCGGCGNKLTDTIISLDATYEGYFINTSMTDIMSLDNYDDVAINYLCISQQMNGMGRDRVLGKRFASKRGMNILETINNFNQKTIYLVTSFGGGSGSSIVSVILSGIKALKESGDFDKTINLIGVLPSIDSSSDVLNNAIQTWNEIMAYDCVDNMIFIDNNNTYEGNYMDEQEINEQFAQLFDSIFEIPRINGRNFDNGNLGKVLNSKNCMYVYNLPSGYENVEQALKHSISNSVLAKMYESNETHVTINGKKKIKCSYIGTSFVDEEYTHEEVLEKYDFENEDFTGDNEENNLILITGCLPPFYSIQVLQAELEEREKEKEKAKKTDFSKFIVNNGQTNNVSVPENRVEVQQDVKKEVATSNIPKPKVRSPKKMMKKNIFDMYN